MVEWKSQSYKEKGQLSLIRARGDCDWLLCCMVGIAMNDERAREISR